MRIFHNIPALSAYNTLNFTSRSLAKSIQKLSTGLRVNSAADDAAGLAISERMKSQTIGLNQAIRNSEDGISLLQTAEGALESTQNILQRMRSLSVQAANDTLTSQDRIYIQHEIDQLRDEIDRIANNTKFNGKRLLNGSAAALWSASDLTMKAYIRGSLLDGQNNAFEGNYKIEIEAMPGKNEVQKTNIYTVKHKGLTKATDTSEYFIMPKYTQINATISNAPDVVTKIGGSSEATFAAKGTTPANYTSTASPAGRSYNNTIDVTFNTTDLSAFANGNETLVIKAYNGTSTITSSKLKNAGGTLSDLERLIREDLGVNANVELYGGNQLHIQSLAPNDKEDGNLDYGTLNAPTIIDLGPKFSVDKNPHSYDASITIPKPGESGITAEDIKNFVANDGGEITFTVNGTQVVRVTRDDVSGVTMRDSVSTILSKICTAIGHGARSNFNGSTYSITINAGNYTTVNDTTKFNGTWKSMSTIGPYENTITLKNLSDNNVKNILNVAGEHNGGTIKLYVGNSTPLIEIQGKDLEDLNDDGERDINDIIVALENALKDPANNFANVSVTQVGDSLQMKFTSPDYIEEPMSAEFSTDYHNANSYKNYIYLDGITNAQIDDFFDNDGLLKLTIKDQNYEIRGHDLADKTTTELIKAINRILNGAGTASISGNKLTIEATDKSFSDSSLAGSWLTNTDRLIADFDRTERIKGTIIEGIPTDIDGVPDISERIIVTNPKSDVKHTVTSSGTPATTTTPLTGSSTAAKIEYTSSLVVYLHDDAITNTNGSRYFQFRVNGVRTAPITNVGTTWETYGDAVNTALGSNGTATCSGGILTITSSKHDAYDIPDCLAEHASGLYSYYESNPSKTTTYAKLDINGISKTNLTDFLSNDTSNFSVTIGGETYSINRSNVSGVGSNSDTTRIIKAIGDAMVAELAKHGISASASAPNGTTLRLTFYDLNMTTDGAATGKLECFGTSGPYTNVLSVEKVTSTEITNFRDNNLSTMSFTAGGKTVSYKPEDLNGITNIDGLIAKLQTDFGTAATVVKDPNGTTITITTATDSAPDSMSNTWSLKNEKLEVSNKLELRDLTVNNLEDFIKNNGSLSVTIKGEKYIVKGEDLADATIESLMAALRNKINGSPTDNRTVAEISYTGGGTLLNKYVIKIRETDESSADFTLDAHWHSETDINILPYMKLEIGDIAGIDTRLYDIQQFWTSEGVYMLKDPQKITITQGDGRTASVMVYYNDTLRDLRDRIQKAIAEDLGQHSGVNDQLNFVSFVEEFQERAYGMETVPGTLVVRSAIAGEAGRLHFSSASEDLLKALGLNTIQEAEENTFNVRISDAHTNTTLVDQVKVTSNKLAAVLHDKIDIEFDPTVNINVSWNDNNQNFDLKVDKKIYTTIIHIVEHNLTFQTGAKEGNILAVSLGDMSSDSLGLDEIIVTDQESAIRAIGQLDKAITRVSEQRARVGAYQNRLEQAITDLSVAYVNLNEATDRILSADMAQEMMEFVKLQIINQSGINMLSQANQLPQSVVSLLK